MIFSQDDLEGNYVGRHYRFVVVDSDKSKSYPSNFVCMLPTQVSVDQKKNNVFSKIFAEKSEEQAKALLTNALANETDSDIKNEIERRLRLLDPKSENQTKCTSCGKMYQGKPRKFKKNYCPACMSKRFRSQE